MRESFRKAFADSARTSMDFLGKNEGKLLEVVTLLVETFRGGRKLLLFGNGGSAADSQHMAAEFINRFRLNRRALPALALSTDTSVLTSISNDFSFDRVFARQMEALGAEGDMVFALSTSGNSPNVLEGVRAARRLGLVSIGFTGGDGGSLVRECDHPLVVPSSDTPRIQECHILACHVIAELVERELAAL
jgi:D-sedoheptulose 7-phosphate isomerase